MLLGCSYCVIRQQVCIRQLLNMPKSQGHFILGLNIDWERPNSQILERERPTTRVFWGLIVIVCI